MKRYRHARRFSRRSVRAVAGGSRAPQPRTRLPLPPYAPARASHRTRAVRPRRGSNEPSRRRLRSRRLPPPLPLRAKNQKEVAVGRRSRARDGAVSRRAALERGRGKGARARGPGADDRPSTEPRSDARSERAPPPLSRARLALASRSARFPSRRARTSASPARVVTKNERQPSGLIFATMLSAALRRASASRRRASAASRASPPRARSARRGQSSSSRTPRASRTSRRRRPTRRCSRASRPSRAKGERRTFIGLWHVSSGDARRARARVNPQTGAAIQMMCHRGARVQGGAAFKQLGA